MAFSVISQQDIDDFAKFYFSDDEDKEKLYGVLYRVCDRAVAQLDEDQRVSLRKACQQFAKLYRFLSQIITFTDVELEKLYVFVVALAKALPYERQTLPYEIFSEAELDSYKIKYLYTQKLELQGGDSSMEGMRPGDGITGGEDELDFLSNIIKQLNDTFGIELTDDDKLDLDKMKEKVMANEELMEFFNPDNTKENIKEKFDHELDEELLTFISTKLDLYKKLTEERANTMLKRLWFNELYNQVMRP
jgi:type I restriction enzyme R subunit